MNNHLLSEDEENLVLAAVDFKELDLTDQMKVSLNKLHDRVVMLVNKERNPF